MQYDSRFIFTGEAEKFMSDKEGIVEAQFPQGHTLMPNDTATFRVAPGNHPVKFVCTERHYDFSEARKCTLLFYFDLA